MYLKDNDKLVNYLGLSRELTEWSQCSVPIASDAYKYGWRIVLHPPVERNDIMYFKLYNIAGECPDDLHPTCGPSSTKCARISITEAQYIECSDTTKNNWILNNDEKEILKQILTPDVWYSLLFHYQNEISGYDDIYGNIDITNLPIPDYSKLPTI